MDTSADTFNVLYGFIGIIVVAFLVQRIRDPLNSLPTVGSSAPILSYVGARRWVQHAREMIEEGCNKYKGGIFKVPTYDRWVVIVNGPKWIDEILRYPDEQMSFDRAGQVLMQAKYTLGIVSPDRQYHFKVIKGQLTRGLGQLFPDIVDEIQLAFQSFVGDNTEEWVSKPVRQLLLDIVARTSNRIFVGAPKCRDEEYLKLVTDFAVKVVLTKNTIERFPDFLKPIVGGYLSHLKQDIQDVAVHLKPLIEEREQMLATYGDDWPDKPNDALMWLIEESKLIGGDTLSGLSQNVLGINFAAIHTSSGTVQHALHRLAASREYQEVLREEIEPILKEFGWTKTSMGRMWKLDSFLKETQRVDGLSAVSVHRVTLKDVTLSNGVVIPADTMIVAAANVTHMDEDNYANPAVFDPFRFSRLREQTEGESTKHQLVSTAPDYISFGHGRHACPGRFFAANELKAIMAHVIMNYDVKFEGDGGPPPAIWHGVSHVAAPTAEILFRKRKSAV